MADIELSRITKRFDQLVAVDAVDLDVDAGEVVCLLGPSGCGKTTTLRVIAGFEPATAGDVLLNGREIGHLPANRRPVNTVFQDYAVFPHMNVAENVGFGLSVRGPAARGIPRRVAEALGMVGVGAKGKRPVAALSGGQRQRVALARAIVCEPQVLLLDEPLSALDASLREQMQVELKNLQNRLGTTFILVTHDQTEALSISDRIVVMNGGQVEQIATPAELYDRPATRFVASFIGTMNLLAGSRHRGRTGRKCGFCSAGRSRRSACCGDCGDVRPAPRRPNPCADWRGCAADRQDHGRPRAQPAGDRAAERWCRSGA